jgi:DNA topoisomerase VI subunit B
MSDELIQKVDTLTATVEALAKTVETLSKVAPVAPPDLTKVLTDIGDLQKFAAGATQAVENAERTTVITKMQLEGRVAFNENGVAYKTDELQKMDLTLLKFAARNSQVIPLVARATYTGSGTPPEGFQFKDAAGKELSADEILEKAWGTKYGDINKMIASTQN